MMKQGACDLTRIPIPSLLLIVAAFTCGIVKGRGGESFPFLIPGFDSAPTATDVSSLGAQSAGASGPVQIVDGHFADGNGARIRLLGVNFSFGANFPEHEDAEKVAAHLAKLGINAVRHHHMDSRDIWRRKADGTRELDPAKLEKLAYLITQLAKKRIYSNLNLHVSRSVTRAEGFPDAGSLPSYNKYVLYLDDRLQTLLKEYARALLTYRNPHTGRRLADEPSLVTVEISNENRFARSGVEPLFSLPPRYQDEFARRWNRYLQKKYVTTAQLQKAWDVGKEPLGSDVSDFADFGRNATFWSLSVRGDNRARLEVGQPGPREGVESVRVAIDQADGVIHQLEFGRAGLSVEAGKLYTLSFWIRSAQPRSVFFDVSRDGSPWRAIGMSETLRTTETWQHVVRPFRATETLPSSARWIFKLGNADSDVYLASPRLRRGGEVMPLGGEVTLEKGAIPVPRTSLQPAVANDLRAFMEETEKTFFAEMIRFLKEDIGVKAPITGSQARWQALAAFEPLDFVDAHAYWQHPHFPGGSWSVREWTIPNTSMLLSPGNDALTPLAWHRVWGRPYTVSEYNHPAPNDYQAECVPLLCAMAALQDWDGVYLYSYQHGSGHWESDRIQSFFDINGNPAKLALLPAGAMIFRRQDVKPAEKRVTARPGVKLASSMALQHRVGARLDSEPALHSLSRAEGREFVSDTGEVRWSHSDGRDAVFSIDTPRTKLVLGFIATGEVELNGFHLKLGSVSRGFGLVALTSLDGAALSVSSHMLLTTMANVENQGMEWNKSRTSVSDRWGAGPPMVEMFPALITIEVSGGKGEGEWKAFALDPTGQRRAVVPLKVDGALLRLEAEPANRTVWYEIARGQAAR